MIKKKSVLFKFQSKGLQTDMTVVDSLPKVPVPFLVLNSVQAQFS